MYDFIDDEDCSNAQIKGLALQSESIQNFELQKDNKFHQNEKILVDRDIELIGKLNSVSISNDGNKDDNIMRESYEFWKEIEPKMNL